VRVHRERTGPAVSPRLFSNFLEHLGGAIYQGLWANVVYNPQFAADKQGRLLLWSRDAGAEWTEDGLEGRSVRLEDGASVSQLVSMPVHRQRRYAGGLWARAEGGTPRITVSLLRPDKPAVFASQSLRPSARGWERIPLEILVPENALEKGEAARLRIACSGGTIRLDMVELFPADHVDGMDPDVLAAARALRIELLRWPGGNFVSGYRWRDGIGPRERRPTRPNPAWWGLETHHFGTDEFMRLCRAIGARPQICVNAGDGTPEEAAAWVQYCNGSVDTPMGRLRAANGHPEPYAVRVWEIGNELYGDWQIGHTDAAGNAERFVRFRRAMLAADPAIEIIATGKGDEFSEDGLARVDAWNEALLDAAKRDGRPPEHLSLHPLVPLPADLGRHSYEEVYQSAMAHPQWWWQSYVPRLKRQIQQRFGPHARTRIALSEWGIIVGGPGWLRFPNHDHQSGSVYAGLFLNALLRVADVVEIANVTALMHGGGIKRPGGVVYVDPMWHVQRMYGQARPERLAAVEVAGPCEDVPARGRLPAVSAVPFLDVVAARRGSATLLFVTNRDARSPRRAEIDLGFAPRSVHIETLAGDARQGNDPKNPRRIAPRRQRLAASGHVLSHNFPPCSVSVLTVE